MTVLSNPIPPYQNFPINANFYQPNAFTISNISRGVTTLVTTSAPNNFVVGQEVRLLIPAVFGSTQLNGMTGFVINILSQTQVEVTINSTQATVFNFSATSNVQNPTILAIGDVNTGNQVVPAVGNVSPTIVGSFINISPL